MTAPKPLAARRRTNSSSPSVAVPSSWEESVVSGAIANRFAVCCPLLNRKGDQTTIDQTSVIPQAARHRNGSKRNPHERSKPWPVALMEDAAGVDDGFARVHCRG